MDVAGQVLDVVHRRPEIAVDRRRVQVPPDPAQAGLDKRPGAEDAPVVEAEHGVPDPLFLVHLGKPDPSPLGKRLVPEERQGKAVIGVRGEAQLDEDVVAADRSPSARNGQVAEGRLLRLLGQRLVIVGKKKPKLVLEDRTAEIDISARVVEGVRLADDRKLGLAGRLKMPVFDQQAGFAVEPVSPAFRDHVDDAAVGRAELGGERIGDDLDLLERIVIKIDPGILHPDSADGQAVDDPVVALRPRPAEAGLTLGRRAPPRVGPDAGRPGRELDDVHDRPVLGRDFFQVGRPQPGGGVGGGPVDQRGFGRDDDFRFQGRLGHPDGQGRRQAEPDDGRLLDDRGEAGELEGQGIRPDGEEGEMKRAVPSRKNGPGALEGRARRPDFHAGKAEAAFIEDLAPDLARLGSGRRPGQESRGEKTAPEPFRPRNPSSRVHEFRP